MLLGCIGDDFTGSSDLANTLAKAGMRVVQYNGVPAAAAGPEIEAGVVALKTRTISPGEAVSQSLAALDWLKAQGCRQYLFKYCSTFDSTPQGNIGPVLDALADALQAERVIVCPVFPATGRTLYQGHLFVGDRLLSESGMQNHPLTPMTDPDIRRWLSRQTSHKVGHVPYARVAAGATSIREALDDEQRDGRRYIVVDAIRDEDLAEIGLAAAGDRLVSGGSGVAIGLPENFRRNGLLAGRAKEWQGETGPAAALCGSCSEMSRRQIEVHAREHPVREMTAENILSGTDMPGAVASWVLSHRDGRIPLVYSSADPALVADAQARHGKDKVAQAIEGFFAELAKALAAGGVKRLIAAGGETSGAVVSALAIPAFEIGPEIDPGVPALHAVGSAMTLALKSGNFGSVDFFARAAKRLGRNDQ